ncbi:MAG: hypothetical protein ABI317_06325, partial [Gaiellales bacterium]
MSFNPNAKLDPRRWRTPDAAGSEDAGSPSGAAVFGVAGIIIYLVLTALTGGSVAGGLGDLSGTAVGTGGSTATLSECRTGADANRLEACRAVGYVNSVQAWWKRSFASSGRTYQPATT